MTAKPSSKAAGYAHSALGLHHPNLWHLHRRSVAGGVAVGMFCGLIPGPFQMIGAAIMSVLFRVNLPVAVHRSLHQPVYHRSIVRAGL